VKLWLLLCGFCCCAIELSDAEMCLLLLLFDREEQCGAVASVVR
jgi:NADH:ubiquinone oxidoreductase subunit B-like Fe-S oxidoreductase